MKPKKHTPEQVSRSLSSSTSFYSNYAADLVSCNPANLTIDEIYSIVDHGGISEVNYHRCSIE